MTNHALQCDAYTVTFCSAAGGATCVSLAAKGAIAGVVQAGGAADLKDAGSMRGIMQLVSSAFFSSMSECAKVWLPLLQPQPLSRR